MALWCEEIDICSIINKKRSAEDSKGLWFKFLLGKDIWMSYLIYIHSLPNYKIESNIGAGCPENIL